MRSFVVLAIAAFSLAGCAATKPPAFAFDPQKSEAMNVMDAAYPDGLASRFLSDTEPPKPAPEGPDVMRAATAGAVTQAVRTHLPGSGITGTDVGVAVVSSLMATSSPDMRLHGNQIIAWMPKNGDDEDAARKAFLELVYKSMVNVVTDHGAPIYRKGKEHVPLGRDFLNAYSKACKPIISAVDGKPFENPAAWINADEPDERPAPLWLGGKDSWFFVGYGAFDKHCFPKGRRKMMRELSALLPDWAYVFTGYPKDPVVLHRGKVLRFVKPN